LTAKPRRRRKVDPRQLDLEETTAASAGDAEKDAPQQRTIIDRIISEAVEIGYESWTAT
jgi:hypothetical protein